MPSYFTYYLAWMLLAYALRRPWFLAGVLFFLILRRYIPDPLALFRALSRGRKLRVQVTINPANVTARRDLANIYLDVLRPRAALKLIQEALARTPNDPELLYLSGVALERSGQHEAALPPLVRAVDLDPRIGFGGPYLVAGDALSALGRHEEAVDAYERYVATNGSDVVGYVRLARVQARLGERQSAEKALAEGVETWHGLPGARRRRSFFRGYLGAFWTRVFWLRQPAPIVFVVVLVLILGGLAHAAYPLVAKTVRRAHSHDRRWPVFVGDHVLYRGHVFTVAKSYPDYDTYKNDPDNLRPADLPLIERLMTEAKVGPVFDDWPDFVDQQMALQFPGYGAGSFLRFDDSRRQFMTGAVEIPGGEKERIFVLQKMTDGSLELVDDFISQDLDHYPVEGRVDGDKLRYFTREHGLVREAPYHPPDDP
jgi:tetratricopeptide (TPR) repeat protein